MSSQVTTYMERFLKQLDAESQVSAPAAPMVAKKTTTRPETAETLPRKLRHSPKFGKGRRKNKRRLKDPCRRTGAPAITDDWLAVTEEDLAAAAACPVDKEKTRKALLKEKELTGVRSSRLPFDPSLVK